MTTVLLVRHGRTTANASGVLAGWTPGVRLDDHGLESAKALAVRLAALPIDGVVTSPMERCRETAEILSASLKDNIRLNSDLDLAECRYGDWTGRKLSDLRSEPLWAAVEQTPSTVTFPNGESLSGVQGRALTAIRRWNATYQGGVYLAVTHGDVIKAILADALGMHLDMFQRIVVEPCSVSIVQYGANRPRVLRVNGTGHHVSRMLGSRDDDAPADVGGGDSTAAASADAGAGRAQADAPDAAPADVVGNDAPGAAPADLGGTDAPDAAPADPGGGDALGVARD